MTRRPAVLLRFRRGVALHLGTVSYWLFPDSVFKSPPSGSFLLTDLLYFMWAVALLQLLDSLVVCKYYVHRLIEHLPCSVGDLRQSSYPHKPFIVRLRIPRLSHVVPHSKILFVEALAKSLPPCVSQILSATDNFTFFFDWLLSRYIICILISKSCLKIRAKLNLLKVR